MANVVISLSLPEDLLREIDAMAAVDHLTRDELLAVGARHIVESERRWQRLQAIGAERARAAGLRSEDDVEEFLDSLPD